MFKVLLFVLLVVIGLFLLFSFVLIIEMNIKKNGLNPYSSILLNSRQKDSLKTIKRIDEDGYLYYMDYKANYNKGFLPWLLRKLGLVKDAGCSCFMVKDVNGDYLTFRNYDLPHKNDLKEPTGLNVVVHLHNDGFYESINMVDAAWISMIKFKYYQGALDDGKTNLTPLFLIPALCMDGMNEKGLCVSILALDTKHDESVLYQTNKTKKSTNISMLLRLMLDKCKNVDEAISLANEYNMVPTFNHDYHLMITDSTGKAIVMEWRYNKMIITNQDACTNFYVSSDDSEDYYFKGRFIESVPIIKTKIKYHIGYGHGYGRFKTIVERLDKNNDRVMSKKEGSNLLESVRQAFDETSTSSTQYSAMYNLNKLEVDICPLMKFTKHYKFNVKGEQIE